MDRYRVYVVALATVVFVVTSGCARHAPVTPVSVPRVSDGTPDPVPTEVAVPTPQPITAGQPAIPEQETAPAISPPALLHRLLDASWKLPTVKGLPPRERPEMDEGQSELIYSGGALRLFRDDDDSLYALVVDHTHIDFQEFKNLTDGKNFSVEHQGKYTSVVRTAPLTTTVREELASKEWTQSELTVRIGEPTRRVHNHGIGTYTVTYVPQGLMFEESTTLRLHDIPAESIWKDEAKSLVSIQVSTDETLEQGKPSPDGKFRAGYVQGGGYWSQWLVVRETGQIEREYHAGYFIEDYFWLDNRRLIYAEAQVTLPYQFHIIDVVSGKYMDSVEVNEEVTKFGPGPGNKIWYVSKDGKGHEVAVP